jgi:hypothetical protein
MCIKIDLSGFYFNQSEKFTKSKETIKVRDMQLVGEKLRQVMSWLVISTVLSCSVTEAKKCSFPAIFNFGDSNSDTGGLSAAFGQVPPPNGITFFHTPAGRYSDGRLIVDFLGNQIKNSLVKIKISILILYEISKHILYFFEVIIIFRELLISRYYYTVLSVSVWFGVYKPQT